jgi:hypothetical protein
MRSRALWAATFPSNRSLRPRARRTAQRDWSLEVTFWAFHYQVLGPACACREVVRKVQAWCKQFRRRVVSGETGAYCLARAKLPLALLGQIFAELAGTLECRMSEGERGRARASEGERGSGGGA